MSALVHCIYTSVQTSPLGDRDVAELVQYSRRKNAENGLTEILLHVRDTFFQILEGPQDVIENLYARILLDPRRTRITQIIFEAIARRYFTGSSMTLATLSPAELAAMLNEDDPSVREQVLTGLDEGRAKRLLRAFTDGHWRAHAVSLPRLPAVPA